MTLPLFPSFRFSPWRAALAFGIGCQVAQVLLLREFLSVFHGNELSIGLALGFWLFWNGVGSRLGAAVSARIRHADRWLAGGAAVQTVMLPSTLAALRLTRLFLRASPGVALAPAQMAWVCALAPAPVCLLFGAQFVWLSRVWREAAGSVGPADVDGAGKTYAGEAAGNMLGGVLFTFALVRFANPLPTAGLTGALLLAAFLPRRSFAGWKRATLALALALAAWPLLDRADAWAWRRHWRAFLPQHRLIASRPSQHGMLAVLRQEDQVSVFQSGHRVFTAAGAAMRDTELEEQDAALRAHVALLQHADPRRILLIGGGLHGALTEILRYPVEQVDYVELDPVLTETARPHLARFTLDSLADPRVRLTHADGRLFLRTAAARYDLILADTPDPATAALNRFYTREFFAEARARLAPGGVLALGAVSTPDLRGQAIALRQATLYHTLRSVFPRVRFGGLRSLLFAAGDTEADLSFDAAELGRRYAERGRVSPRVSERLFETALREPQLSRINWTVRRYGRMPGDERQPPTRPPLAPGALTDIEREEADWPPPNPRRFLNSDFRPVAAYYTMMHADDLAGPDRLPVLRIFLRIQPEWGLALLAVALVVAAASRWRDRRRPARTGAAARFAVLFAVFTTGLSTMAMQIALIFAFQSVYGYVYEMIGLIMAVFMGGLALGALGTGRFVADKTNRRLLAIVQGGIAVLAALMAVALPFAGRIASPILSAGAIFGLTFLAGLINGVDFPLATACRLHGGPLFSAPEKATGSVYGMELFGACVGALLAGVIVAPLHGVLACCLLAAAVNGTACALLGIASAKR